MEREWKTEGKKRRKQKGKIKMWPGGGGFPYVSRYYLPVTGPLFWCKTYTQWLCFSLQSTPNDPFSKFQGKIFKNLNAHFIFLYFQLMIVNLYSNLTQFTSKIFLGSSQFAPKKAIIFVCVLFLIPHVGTYPSLSPDNGCKTTCSNSQKK